MVVDKLRKYAHFMALSHPFTSLQVSQNYLDHVFKLHGFPKSIVSNNRDKIHQPLLVRIYEAPRHQAQTFYNLSPQTNSQYAVLNRCLESYLRCFCHEKSQEWTKWLALAEFWYNTTYHTATRKTPFEIVYNQPPYTDLISSTPIPQMLLTGASTKETSPSNYLNTTYTKLKPE